MELMSIFSPRNETQLLISFAINASHLMEILIFFPALREISCKNEAMLLHDVCLPNEQAKHLLNCINIPLPMVNEMIYRSNLSPQSTSHTMLCLGSSHFRDMLKIVGVE